MTPKLTTQDLYASQASAMKLSWVAGHSGGGRLLEPTTAKYPGMALVGYLNFVHPNRFQVIGDAEAAYLRGLKAKRRRTAVRDLFGSDQTAAVIVTNAEKPAIDLVAAANAQPLPLFATPLPSPVVIDHLQYHLTRALAPRVTVHGVYLEVMGMGVLLTGEAGIGKSELALELLSRNHRLIADDAVEFVRIGPDVLVGQCPSVLSDYLEVRGLGILDVRTMFGETAVRHKKRLHLIVRMEKLSPRRLKKVDRLQARQLTRAILDVEVPEVVLFVGAGRNLAILVEAATRAYILRMWGVDTLKEFMQRQKQRIDRGT